MTSPSNPPSEAEMFVAIKDTMQQLLNAVQGSLEIIKSQGERINELERKVDRMREFVPSIE